MNSRTLAYTYTWYSSCAHNTQLDHTLFSGELRIVLALCRDFEAANYAQNCAGIILASLVHCSLCSTVHILSTQEKCARYWPAQGTEEYGSLEVTVITTSTLENHISTVLQLRNLDTEEVRSVQHYRLTCWPHQGVPKHTKPVTDFLRYCVSVVVFNILPIQPKLD